MTIVAVLLGPTPDTRSYVLLALVLVWAVRLGSYLFTRIRKVGKDDRFDAIKPSFIRFLNAWTLQALWVSITLAAALAAITTMVRQSFGVVAIVGLVVWLFGFGLEAAADRQKSRFRADPANRRTFGLEVHRIDRSARGWRLQTSAGDIDARQVVVANGNEHTPHIPDFPGADSSTIEVLHSSAYRNPSPFAGKRVLVAGTGSSGMEIAHDLATGGAAKVWL